MQYTEFVIDSKIATNVAGVFSCSLNLNWEINEMKLLTANIPHVWYNVRAGHDAIAWTDNLPHALTVPAGNYDDVLLTDAVADIMSAEQKAVTYTCAISEITGKCTVTNTTPAVFDLTVVAGDVWSEFLGFDPAIAHAGLLTYTAENIATIDRQTFIGFKINNTTAGVGGVETNIASFALLRPYDNIFGTNGALIAAIDVTEDAGSYIHYKAVEPINVIFGTPVSDVLYVSFTNMDGDIVDFGNSYWSCKLGVRYTHL